MGSRKFWKINFWKASISEAGLIQEWPDGDVSVCFLFWPEKENIPVRESLQFFDAGVMEEPISGDRRELWGIEEQDEVWGGAGLRSREE